jgi:hypothetical protein
MVYKHYRYRVWNFQGRLHDQWLDEAIMMMMFQNNYNLEPSQALYNLRQAPHHS